MTKSLISEAIFIIREAVAQFKRPAVMWSTGKDSTIVLDLISMALNGINMPVIHIDTGRKFLEIYKFRERISEEWGFREHLVVKQSIDAYCFSYRPRDHFACCTRLKTESLKEVIEELKIDALIVSIRRDEHGIRNKERFMSPRNKNFEWGIVQEKEGGDSGLESLQDVEMSGWGLFESDFGEDCNHVRIHPILSWTEVDVWEYIKYRNLPFNPLYSAKYMWDKHGIRNIRYRSIGCNPCSQPIKSMASTIDEIIEELRETVEDERVGRVQDKDKELVMERMRALGYF